MLSPRVKITFTKSDNTEITFSFIHGFETFESYEKLTGTCNIVLARKFQTMEGKDLFGGTNPLFKRGDQVKVESGYFPNIRTNFEGYIKTVSANIPIELECEDSMYLLKKYTFNIPSKIPLLTTSKSGKFLKRPKIDTTKIKKISLKELLNIIIPDDIEYKIVGNINLGKIRKVNATPAIILESLRTSHGLFSRFIGKILYVGFASDALNTNEAEFKMEEVVINSNDLIYRQADEINLKVRATAMDDNDIIETVEVGDNDGEQEDYHYYNVTKEELTKLANERLNEAKYTGYHGTIETFLEPSLKSGDRAKITSAKLPERDGVYLIKSVRRLVHVKKGGRQFLELGKKVSA